MKKRMIIVDGTDYGKLWEAECDEMSRHRYVT